MKEYGTTETDPQYDAVLALVRQAQQRGWWTRYNDILTGSYVELEAEATAIANYEAFGVPGLAQTPGYAQIVSSVLGCGVTPTTSSAR